MAQKRLIAGLFRSLGHLHSSRQRRESPHKLPAEFLKSILVAGARRCSLERGAKYKRLAPSVNPFFGPRFALALRPSPQASINSRARSIAKDFGLSTRCHKNILW